MLVELSFADAFLLRDLAFNLLLLRDLAFNPEVLPGLKARSRRRRRLKERSRRRKASADGGARRLRAEGWRLRASDEGSGLGARRRASAELDGEKRGTWT
ncbi:uncharacterized protein A4U43_UnF3120 [Asparagus officinalis]|uniref:Uncharacterized protein n=1 Tax=Asparagus officinalis TaxID=4686 RepID=A0A1R3L746_ASPOF|nr:uncharacterized protein A4U43_UnF3120 [Asparagus officinalis]